MAVVFQFHRINLPPLHLSYITFAMLAIILLPSPNQNSNHCGTQCYDLGTMSMNANIKNKWHTIDDLSTSKNVSEDKKDILRYVSILPFVKNHSLMN